MAADTIEVAAWLMQKAIEENARSAQNQKEYNKKYIDLEKRSKAAEHSFNSIA